MLFVSHLAAFCLAFSIKTHSIQHQNALYLAPKCTLFSTKTHSIQHQNALHLAAKRTLFCSKQPRKWCKWRLFEINIHFSVCTDCPLFAPKPTFARIVFLRQGERLVNENGTHNVKFLTKNQTKTIALCTRAYATTPNARALTTASAWGCRACSQRPTEIASWKRRSNLPSTVSFLACSFPTRQLVNQVTSYLINSLTLWLNESKHA